MKLPDQLQPLRKKADELFERFEQISLRERIMVLGGTALALLVFWNLLLIDPLLSEQKKMSTALNKLRAEKTENLALLEVLTVKSQQDPDKENREKLEVLKKDLAMIEEKLQGSMQDMVSPQEMPALLEEIFRLQSGLKLISVENVGASAWPPAQEGSPGAEAAGNHAQGGRVYKHLVRIEFEGSFGDTLAYLEALEKFSGRLLWDRLEFEVQEYPLAKVVLTVGTLSIREGWIGV